MQETFIRAYKGWGGFAGRSEVLTFWLYTIASRACRRLERRRAGQPRRVGSLERLLELPPPGDPVRSDESPLDYTIRREEVGRPRAALSTLPAAFRLPLVLKELEGLSVHEVAVSAGSAEASPDLSPYLGWSLALR